MVFVGSSQWRCSLKMAVPKLQKYKDKEFILSEVVDLYPILRSTSAKPFLKTLWFIFLWMGFNCLKATKPLRGGSLLFTTKFPEIPGTHMIALGRMKG